MISTKMKLKLLFLVVLVAVSVYTHEALSSEKSSNSKEAIASLITKYATKYDLDRTQLSCLFKIESSYRLNVISKTRDHGIGQINERTATNLKMNVKKLTNNLEYSIERSAHMLAYYKWLKQDEEPRQWPCRYNVGPGPLTKRGRGAACENYLERFYGCTTGTLVGVL